MVVSGALQPPNSSLQVSCLDSWLRNRGKGACSLPRGFWEIGILGSGSLLCRVLYTDLLLARPVFPSVPWTVSKGSFGLGGLDTHGESPAQGRRGGGLNHEEDPKGLQPKGWTKQGKI